MLRNLFTAALLGLLWSGCANWCSSQEKDGPQTQAGQRIEKRIRKLLVPEADFDEFIEQRRGYVPMNRLEFDKLLAQHAKLAKLDRPAFITRSVFNGSLDSNGELSGEAFLYFENPAETAELVSLSDFNLFLSDALWLDAEAVSRFESAGYLPDSAAEDSGRPDAVAAESARDATDVSAMIGNDAEGNLKILVNKTGVLRLGWKHPGLLQADKDAGRLSFPFVLPPAVNSRIFLKLPGRYSPIADDCKIELVAGADEAHELSGESPPAEQTWSLNCGTQAKLQIELTDREQPTEPPDQTAFAESLTYNLRPTGIEFESAISLANVKLAENGLRFKLPKEVVCTSIQFEGAEAPYHVERTDEAAFIMLNLSPAALASSPLRIVGYAPLQPGQITRLPRLQLENLAWRRSEIKVLVSSMLELQEFQRSGMVLQNISGANAKNEDRVYQFQAFEKDFQIDVACRPRVAALTVASLCKAEIGLESIEATQTCILRARQGFAFSIEADYPAYWIIDSVSAAETEGAPVAEKLVSYWESRDATADDAKKLFVQFARPIDATQAILLNVQGHRTFAANADARLEEFNMLSFELVVGQEDWCTKTVSLNNKANTRLNLEEGNALLKRVAIDELDPLLVKHGSITDRDLILSLNQPADGAAKVVIERESQQQFDVEIMVTGFIATNQVREEMRIDCRPAGTEVGRLEIGLLGAETPVQWRLGDAAGSQLITRHLESRDVETGAGLVKEEIWEIELRPPRTEPFTVLATLLSNRQTAHRLTRAHVRNAQNQSQRILVGTVGGARAAVEAGEFESIPWQLSDREPFSELLGSYRPISANHAPLVIKNPEVEPVVSAWADRVHVDYRFDGRSDESVARFYLKNHGADAFVFRLPPASVLHSVHVDGTLVEFAETEDGHFSCRLPADKEDLLVTMLYTSHQGPVGLSKSMLLSSPDIDLPILNRRQTVFLTDGWVVTDNWRPIGYETTLWEEVRDRLFGGLTIFVFSKASAQSWPVSSGLQRDSYRQHLQFGSEEAGVDERAESALTSARQRYGFSGDGRVVDLDDVTSATYRLVNVRWIELGRWLALLSSFCLALSVQKRRRKLLLFVAALAGAICLVVPLAFAPLFAAVFWGNLLSLLLLSLKIAEPAANRNTVLADVLIAGQRDALTVSTLFLGCALLFLQNPVLALDEPSAKPPRIVYYDVVLPIDKDDRISGDVAYVPRELYSAMITDKSLSKSQSLPVIFVSADYQCEMQANEQGNEISLKEISATINFRTSRDVTSVLIPIDTNSILLTRDSVRLDAMQVPIRLPNEGIGFYVEAKRPGQHKLSFRFQPAQAPENRGWQELNLAVPRIHASTLAISLPRLANSPNLISDVCVLRLDRANRHYQASLGPAGRLALRWPRQIPLANETAVTLVDQLLKTEFTLAGAEYEYLWLLKNREPSSTDVLEIEIDSGLELLEQESSRALVKNAAGVNRNRFVFEATQNKDVLFVTAKFRERANSVFGYHYLPRVSIPSASIDAYLASLAADPSLELRLLGDPQDVLNDSVNTFVQLWGRARVADHAKVDRVVRIDDAKPRWPLAVAPREVEYAAVSASRLTIGPDRARFDGTVELNGTFGAPSFVEFVLPAGFRIRSVEVPGSDDQQILRLIDLNRCQLTVDRRGNKTLPVQIAADCDIQQPIPFPALQVLNCQRQVRSVSVVRSHNQDVLVSPPQGFESTVGQSGLGLDEWSQRFDSSWIGREEIQAGGQVRVQRSALADRGLLVTTLKKEGSDFLVDFDCLVQGAEETRLDAIQLSVSDAVTEILSASVPGEFRLVELPLTSRKRIEFVPDQTLVPHSRVMIRARISQRRSLPPNVFWANFADGERHFVRLPKEVDGTAVEWSVEELASIKSETLLKQVEKLSAARSYDSFQVLRSDYQAVMEVSTTHKRELQIPLQVSSIAWSGNEYLVGTCEFELSPADPVLLYLDHNPTISVIQATVDGLPAEFLAAEGFCRVELPGSRFPRHLAITFRARIFTQRDAANFEFGLFVPRDHKVETHLFQISLPISRRNLLRASSVDALAPHEFALRRLESLAGLVNTLPLQSSVESERDRGNWMLGWYARILEFARLDDSAPVGAEASANFEKIRQAVASQVESLTGDASRLSGDTAPISKVSPASIQHDGYTVWQGMIADRNESVRLSFGRARRASVRLPSQVSIAVALLLGCVVVLATPVWSWLGRIAHPVALVATALLGLSWTIFFTPAFVGWLVALAAVCVALRSVFSRRRYRIAARDDALLASQ